MPPLDGMTTTGRNYAAVAPLQQAKRVIKNPKDNPSSTNAFFREMWQGLWTENDPGWRQVIEQARVISLLRSGKLTMKSDLTGNGFVFFKRTRSRDRSNYPLFPQNSEILTAKWAKAQPAVKARSFADGYKAQIQLGEIETLVNYYFREIFDSIYETREAYSAQDYGTYITQFGYDDKLNQLTKIIPVLQDQSKVAVTGYGGCLDCQFEGHPDDFAKSGAPYPQCPQCDSFRTTPMVPDTVVSDTVISDIDLISQGDIFGRLLDFPSCRYDARVFPHESDWFATSERVPIRLLESMFGEDLEIEDDNLKDIGFRVMDALAVRGGTTDQLGASDLYSTYRRFEREGVVRNMWLTPAMYSGFKLEKAEKTLSGTIPAGIPFDELFPKGICVRGFNDMKLILGVYAEQANVSSGVYLYQSHSGMGKGVADAVDSAKDLNEVYSMAMAGVKRYGAPGIAIAANAGVTQENVRDLFRPEKAVFVDTAPFGNDINKVITSVQAPVMNAAMPQLMIQLANMLNIAFMTGDFTQGVVQDVSINTLGGQQLAHAKAEEQKSGILARKSLHREISAEIICRLAREHMVLPKWYPYERHGKIKGKFITGRDIPADIKFDAIPDSEIPENKFEKRMKAQEMIENSGGIQNFIMARQADAKTTAWYVGLYGLTMPDLDEAEIQEVCLDRMEKIKDLANVYTDPSQIIPQLGLQIREEGHLLKAQFLCSILDDDEFQSATPLVQASINALIEEHYNLEAESQYRNQTIGQGVQNTLAAQQQNASAQIMAPQIQQAQAQQQNDQANQALQEVGGRILDDSQAEADAQRQKEAQGQQFQQQQDADAANHARALALQNHKHQQQMQLQKAANEHALRLQKAKPAPSKTAAKR